MEIKDVIYEYLDKNYPIEGSTVTVDVQSVYSFRHIRHVHDYKKCAIPASQATIEKWASVLGSELFDKLERDNEVFINKKKDNAEKYTVIDKDIVEMFGVKWKSYFWDWTEDRIGDDVVVQFRDAQTIFNKRIRSWSDISDLHRWSDAKIKLPPFTGSFIDVP